jgi:hypothetical protein
MSASLSIGAIFSDSDAVIPRLGQFVEQLRDRTGLHEAIGRRALHVTRDWLIEIAQTRHNSAQRLGAEPSGFWGRAAEQVHSEADQEAATVTVSGPGIGRAAHDVDIEPGEGKKFLTIPLCAEAYNQRAYRVPGLFVFKGTMGGLFLAAKNPDGSLNIWYALVASVHQQQDRSLLPSDTDYTLAAMEGAHDYVSYLLSKKEAA